MNLTKILEIILNDLVAPHLNLGDSIGFDDFVIDL